MKTNATPKGLAGQTSAVITATLKRVAQLIIVILVLTGSAVQAAVPGPEESGSELDTVAELKVFWGEIPKVKGAVRPTAQQWDDIIVLILPNWQRFVSNGKLNPSAQADKIRKALPTGRVLYIKVQKGVERLTADADSPALGITTGQFEAACAERGIELRKGPRQW